MPKTNLEFVIVSKSLSFSPDSSNEVIVELKEPTPGRMIPSSFCNSFTVSTHFTFVPMFSRARVKEPKLL